MTSSWRTKYPAEKIPTKHTKQNKKRLLLTQWIFIGRLFPFHVCAVECNTLTSKLPNLRQTMCAKKWWKLCVRLLGGDGICTIWTMIWGIHQRPVPYESRGNFASHSKFICANVCNEKRQLKLYDLCKKYNENRFRLWISAIRDTFARFFFLICLSVS